MMWPVRLSLISSIIAASVVDLPEPVGPRDEDEAARLHRQLGERGRKIQLLERLQLLRDDPEGGADRLALEVDVDAKACESRHRVRHVDLTLDLELLLLLRREDAVEQLLRVVGRQGQIALKPLELAPETNRGWSPYREVKIGRPAGDHCLQQLVDRLQGVWLGWRHAGHEVGYRHAPGVT